MVQTDSNTSKDDQKLKRHELSLQHKIQKTQGHWTEEEHTRYLLFFETHQAHNSSKRIFKQMS